MKEYIVYRYYFNALFWTYERLELTEKELKNYLFKHQQELKNIEAFKKEKKTKINIEVNINLE